MVLSQSQRVLGTPVLQTEPQERVHGDRSLTEVMLNPLLGDYSEKNYCIKICEKCCCQKNHGKTKIEGLFQIKEDQRNMTMMPDQIKNKKADFCGTVGN